METLAPRLLLAVNLDGSTLRITGTEGDDRIVVAANKRFINFLSAGCNDQLLHVALSAIWKIEIGTFGGNDRILIDSSLDPLLYHAFVDAGAGNDRVYTSSGNDTILAGDGNDKIYSNYGDDSIDGGAGRDLIVAGDGRNIVIGGAHNDNISTGSNDDRIYPGKGNDYVDAGDGADLISDPSGADTVLAGWGNDTGKIGGAGGVVNCGEGEDTFVATGGTALYGFDGRDNLQGALIFGGDHEDTLTGLAGNDEIHGGAGDDLIRGFTGSDTLSGDEGNDAIFGGSDNDTIYGGAGDDNLYGTDGHLDKHPELAGRDVGFGQDGLDWFETGYKWNRTDRRDGNDRAVGLQNNLPQDTSYGWYTGSGVTYGSVSIGSGVTQIIPRNPLPKIETKSLGAAGWISSGAWDTTQETFVPPPITHKERLSIGRVILKVPVQWEFGELAFARDEIVWYRITQAATSGNQPNDLVYVPTLHGGAANVQDGLPRASDGADPPKYRFLGVKRGTVLIGGASPVGAAQSVPLNTGLLNIHLEDDLRLAGYDRIYRQIASYDQVPLGGPRSLRGILVGGGAIWLPTDGSEPYFSSGKN
jgi:hypothetical protein